MDILSFSLTGFKKGMVLSVMLLFILVSITPAILMPPVDGEDSAIYDQTMELQPDQRSGDYYLEDVASEYSAYATDGNGYFGAKMRKLDFNGDGITDIAISQPGKGNIFIFDGKTQLKFPELAVSPDTAKWTISGGSYFGTDFDVGDVNGDGSDDVLGVYSQGSSGTVGLLYYGGPYVDSQSSFPSANATFFCRSYGYYGSYAAIGDMDGDGFGDVIVGDGGYQFVYSRPPGYSRWYTYYYGQTRWWFGGNETEELQGSYSYGSSDGELTPPFTRKNDYGSYGYSYHYGYQGTGGVATGDMNGDGRDEIAFGSPRAYDANGYTSYVGAVYVLSPKSTIRSFNTGDIMESSSHMDWAGYYGSSTWDCVGADPQIVDYNDDGYGDLIFGGGLYTYSQQGSNGKYTWIIDGSDTFQTGTFKMSSASSYTLRLESDSTSRGFGAHTFGDFDGDGKLDLALGSWQPGEVYVILNDQFNGKTGTLEVSEISVFTVHAPKDSSKFAYLPEYYRYYSYNYGHVYSTLMLLDRDNDGLDDLFIADPGANVEGSTNAGMIYGISNKDVFGIGDFRASDGDLPDGRTYYAEYKSYKFVGSAWNRWDVWGSGMAWTFEIGHYHATVEYSNPDMIPYGGEVIESDDEFNIIRLEDGSMNEILDEVNDTLLIEFNILFTSNLPVEGDLDVTFDANLAHISYKDTIKDLGAVKNRFFFQGTLRAYHEKDGDMIDVKNRGWLQENTELFFTGPKLVYNGTQNFMQDFGVPPLYPRDDLFNITLVNSLGYTDVDPESSGKDFIVGASVGDLPLAVEFHIDQDGIPSHRVLNSVPVFTVNVDVDIPTAPPGVVIHADSFDDPNTIVDNDNELFVTWHEPSEFNSGIDYYEVECEGNIQRTEATFAKVEVNGTGVVEVSVRAIDRVGHIGEWSTASIFIDTESVEFTNPVPDPEAGENWFNTLTPTVGLTVTDIGGRAIIGDSIDYVLSRDGGETWGEWIPAGIGLSARSLDITVNPMLVEGSLNRIMFRASDEAGNMKESEAYTINVDVSGVKFQNLRVNGIEDWEGTWLDDSAVDIDIDVVDHLSGFDGSTLEYKFTTSGRSDLNSAEWIPLVSRSGNEVTISISDLEMESGDRNFIRFRARDLVENPYSYSDVYNIWINTLPKPVIVSPEEDAEFLEGDMVVFDSSLSTDMDGDVLYYTWTDTITFEGETETVILGEEGMESDRFQEALSPGKHSIVLTVSDGLHEVSSDPLAFTVKEVIVPIWYSSEDTDGDGMPNYWEYNYYLGWNDPSNKDNLYNPSTMEGMTREEMFELLKPEFANSTSAISPENDADGDGHTDFEEYLYGTDPTDALDFPIYERTGEEAEEEADLLMPVLISISLLVIVILIVMLVLFNGYLRNKLEASRIKEAEEETQLMEKALSAGGRERLDQLMSSARGEGLPAISTTAALPSGEQTLDQPEAQPMQAQPMEADPMDMNGMQAAPMSPDGMQQDQYQGQTQQPYQQQ